MNRYDSMTIQTHVLLSIQNQISDLYIVKVLNCPSPDLNIKMEEIRLEEEKDQDDQTERKETIREKLTRAFYGMTIEPMMFLQGLGWCMTSISQTQMLLYKTCRGKVWQAQGQVLLQVRSGSQAQGQGRTVKRGRRN